MKRTLIFFCLLNSGILFSQAPQNVFDCIVSPDVTQQQIDPTSEFYKQCIEFSGGNYLFNGSDNHTVNATDHITLKPGFHAGQFDPNGKMHLKMADASSIDVAVMNYLGPMALQNVLRYEKLELGVILPLEIQNKVANFINGEPLPSSDIINPFLEWELKVQAIFFHPNSGDFKFIDGFYYREMIMDESNNLWVDQNTQYPFRIRFAPPEVGNWNCQIRISVNEQLMYESNNFRFNVIESGNKGYVKVHENDRNLKLGDEIFYPVGQNLPFPYEEDNMLYARTPDQTLNTQAWVTYKNLVHEYNLNGGKYFRFIMSPSCSDIEFEELGNYYDRIRISCEIDELLSYAEDNDMFLSFNMMLHTPIQLVAGYSQYGWDFGDIWPPTTSWPYQDLMPQYCYKTVFNFNYPHEAFLNESSLSYFKQRYRYIISRWGYSTAIYMFELLSEPWHLDEFIQGNTYIKPYEEDLNLGEYVRFAAQNFHDEISGYIKNEMSHKEHLLGSIGRLHKDFNIYPHNQNLLGKDQSWFNPNIDVICCNHYAGSPDKLIVNKNSSSLSYDSEEKSVAFDIKTLRDYYSKPVFLTEFGPGEVGEETYGDCSDYIQNNVDIQTAGFLGAAGFNMWDGFVSNQTFLWDQVINTKDNLVNSYFLDVLENEGGNWLQGRQVEQRDGKAILENQFYISEDRNKAVGYIKNRTYNSYTFGLGFGLCLQPWANEDFNEKQTLFWNSIFHHLFVDGLESLNNYHVEFFDASDGQIVPGSEYENFTFDSKMRLEFPDLIVSNSGIQRPVLWYYVEKENNSNISINNNPANIESTELKESFMFTLNKTSNLLSVKSQFSFVEIYSINGEMLFSTEMVNGSCEFNTENLPSGIYFIRSGANSKKFVVF